MRMTQSGATGPLTAVESVPAHVYEGSNTTRKRRDEQKKRALCLFLVQNTICWHYARHCAYSAFIMVWMHRILRELFAHSIAPIRSQGYHGTVVAGARSKNRRKKLSEKAWNARTVAPLFSQSTR